jgi:hypothetical protein
MQNNPHNVLTTKIHTHDMQYYLTYIQDTPTERNLLKIHRHSESSFLKQVSLIEFSWHEGSMFIQ